MRNNFNICVPLQANIYVTRQGQTHKVKSTLKGSWNHFFPEAMKFYTNAQSFNAF
jgi:hypothetical protein